MPTRNLDNYHNIKDPRIKNRRLELERQFKEETWICDCGSRNVQSRCPNCDYPDEETSSDRDEKK